MALTNPFRRPSPLRASSPPAPGDGHEDPVARTGGQRATQRRAIHVELSTDDLDGLYAELVAKGVVFHAPPHDEPWERSMTALDPDGYAVEFAQGRRGDNRTD